MAKKTKKNITSSYLSTSDINKSLWDHGWINNTLSPVTQEPYWKMLTNIIPSDEKPISAFFAYSHAGNFLHSNYVFLATDKQIYIVVESAGYIISKQVGYDDVLEMNLYSDYWLHSLTYIEMYLTKFMFYKLESSDPTSVVHFKNTVIGMQKKTGIKKSIDTVVNINNAKKLGISVWRFFWRKIHWILSSKGNKKKNQDLIKEDNKTTETKTTVSEQGE